MARFLNDRLELQSDLESILGSRNVYFQPPESIMMNYPCIVYKLDAVQNIAADDIRYVVHPRYQLTLIDRDPDSEYLDALSELPYCVFERYYAVDNLNHFVFSIYS